MTSRFHKGCRSAGDTFCGLAGGTVHSLEKGASQEKHISEGKAMNEDLTGAILQRDKKTYAIVPRTPVGLLTPKIMESIARVARQHAIPIIKITSGQRLALVGIEGPQVAAVWKDLGMEPGRATELCLHSVQACPGTTVCRYGVQDSLELGMTLEKLYADLDLPAKLKIGVSGCSFNCGESYVRDVGLIGRKKGWTVVFGGNSGGRPRIGDELAEDLSRQEAIDLVGRCLQYYRANAKKKERTARFMERSGVEAMRAAVTP
jgi:NAD(P)H-nitrite reductase large subunit